MPTAIGHVSAWGNYFKTNGFVVNVTPVVGSIAWDPDVGKDHVAYVEAVSSNAGSQFTSERRMPRHSKSSGP
jgi:surface antigen